jgi:hypothetical protein
VVAGDLLQSLAGQMLQTTLNCATVRDGLGLGAYREVRYATGNSFFCTTSKTELQIGAQVFV